MRQGCWATKRKCSFDRIRFGSLMVSTLLSIFAPAPLWVRWSDVVSGSLASVLRFNQGDGTVLEVRHQLRRNPRPRQRVLFQAAVEERARFPHSVPKWQTEARCLVPRSSPGEAPRQMHWVGRSSSLRHLMPSAKPMGQLPAHLSHRAPCAPRPAHGHKAQVQRDCQR